MLHINLLTTGKTLNAKNSERREILCSWHHAIQRQQCSNTLKNIKSVEDYAMNTIKILDVKKEKQIAIDYVYNTTMHEKNIIV